MPGVDMVARLSSTVFRPLMMADSTFPYFKVIVVYYFPIANCHGCRRKADVLANLRMVAILSSEGGGISFRLLLGGSGI